MQLQENPIPADYLNTIAAPQVAPGRDKKFLFIIGGVVIVLLIAIVAMLTSGSGKPKPLETIALRMQTFQKISQDANKNIKSSKLRSINGNLQTFLINANRDIAKPLESNKIELKKIDKKTLAAEDGSKLKKTLEDARFNSVFDRVYAREMAYELERIQVLMSGLYKTSSSKSLKEFLDKSYKDLETLQKDFASFNAATS